MLDGLLSNNNSTIINNSNKKFISGIPTTHPNIAILIGKWAYFKYILEWFVIRLPTNKHVCWKISANVDGGLSGGCHVRRPLLPGSAWCLPVKSRVDWKKVTHISF